MLEHCVGVITCSVTRTPASCSEISCRRTSENFSFPERHQVSDTMSASRKWILLRCGMPGYKKPKEKKPLTRDAAQVRGTRLC